MHLRKIWQVFRKSANNAKINHHVCIGLCVCLYVFVCVEREKERERLKHTYTHHTYTKKKVFPCIHIAPSIRYEVMWLDAMNFIFWMLSFYPAFSLSSFTFKRLFNSSLLSDIRVVSFAYLRLLIFLATILIPVCASPSPAFHMMYSACMLNKHRDKIQLWCISFPIWNQSIVPCMVLTLALWPA